MLALPKRRAAALAVILVALVALEWSVLAWMQGTDPRALEAPDTASYENPARALMKAGRFAASPDALDQSEVTRTPGYPLLIAGAEWVFGDDPANAVRAAIVIGALGLFALYAGARRLGLGVETALAAVGLAAIEPGTLLASQMLLPETLFTALLTTMLYCGTRLAEGGRRAPAFALVTGGLLAAATMVRPISYFFIAPLLIWAWLAERAHGAARFRASAICAAVLAPWLAIVGGWQLRNAVVFGDATFSQIQNVNLYRYRAADVVARHDGITLDEAQARLQAESDAVPAGPERFRYFKAEGLRRLRAHPSLALRSAFAGLVKTVAGPGTIDLYMHFAGALPQPGPLGDLMQRPFDEFRDRWVARYPVLVAMLVAEALYLAVLYLGSAAGLLLGWPVIRRAFFPHALWLGCVAYLLAVSAGPEAYARFRVPMVPVLACYAAWGVALVVDRFRRRRD